MKESRAKAVDELPASSRAEIDGAIADGAKPVRKGKKFFLEFPDGDTYPIGTAEYDYATRQKDAPSYSFSSPVANPETVSGIRTAIEKALGKKAANWLIGTKRIVLHETPDSLPDGLASQVSRFGGKVSGLFDPKTKKIHLIASWIRQGEGAAKLGHEGWHMFLDALKHQNSKMHRTMMNRLAFIAKSKDAGQWFEKAKSRIPARDKQRGEDVTLNELAAYAIEEYERAPRSLPQAVMKWVQDFIAEIRAALIRHGFEFKNLTAADLAAISRRFLRQQATTEESSAVQTFPDGEALAEEFFASIYSDRADMMGRAFDAMGFYSFRDSSRVSGSEYVLVYTETQTNEDGTVSPADDSPVYKFRVSNHTLPGHYEQADYDVEASSRDTRGDTGGDWIDAVAWLSEKTGQAPKGRALTLIRKRQEERQALEAEAARVRAEREALKTNAVEKHLAELKARAKTLPDGTKIKLSKRDRFFAELPDGTIINLGDRPSGVEKSRYEGVTVQDGEIVRDGAPFFSVEQESEEELRQAFRDTERAYGGRTAYDQAKKAGKTKLNYRQWVQVRTPRFKKWFGDFEAAALRDFMNGKPVASIPGNQAPHTGFAALRKWATDLFNAQGGKAVSPELGDVLLDERAVRDSIGHGMNETKAEAFAAVKAVIEKGRIVQRGEKDGVPSIYVAAPVRIGGVDDVVIAVIHTNEETNRMYLHSVVTKENLQGDRVKSGGAGSVLSGHSQLGGAYSIVQNALNFKGEVSKVTDPETGEPMVMYHGGKEGVREFRVSNVGAWFSSGREIPEIRIDGNGEIYPVFLSIKNPKSFVSSGQFDAYFDGLVVEVEDAGSAPAYKDRLQAQGHDGIGLEGTRADYGILDNQYVVFSPNQIKSATANTGAFSEENDIMFSVEEETEQLRVARDGTIQERQVLARSTQNPEVQMTLAKDTNLVLSALLKNPNLAPEVQEALAALAALAKDGKAWILDKLTILPNLAPSLHVLAATSENLDIRKSLARRNDLSQDVQEILAMDKKNSVLMALAENPNISTDIQEILARKDTIVRGILAGNANISPKVQILLANDREAHVRSLLSRNEAIITEAQVILARDENLANIMAQKQNIAPEVQEILAKGVARVRLASNPGIIPKLQLVLARDESVNVRAEVASNRNVTPEAQVILAQYENENISGRLAQNPNVASEAQNILVAHREDYIRELLAKNSRITPEVQMILARDKTKDIRIALARNSRITPEGQNILAKDRVRGVRTALMHNRNLAPGAAEILSEGIDNIDDLETLSAYIDTPTIKARAAVLLKKAQEDPAANSSDIARIMNTGLIDIDTIKAASFIGIHRWRRELKRILDKTTDADTRLSAVARKMSIQKDALIAMLRKSLGEDAAKDWTKRDYFSRAELEEAAGKPGLLYLREKERNGVQAPGRDQKDTALSFFDPDVPEEIQQKFSKAQVASAHPAGFGFSLFRRFGENNVLMTEIQSDLMSTLFDKDKEETAKRIWGNDLEATREAMRPRLKTWVKEIFRNTARYLFNHGAERVYAITPESLRRDLGASPPDSVVNAWIGEREARAEGFGERTKVNVGGKTYEVWGAIERDAEAGQEILFSVESVEQEEPTGHAQPLTAKVLTPSGFKLMGDIHVGDEVITIDGSATKVTDIFPQGKKPIYRVVLSDGSETRATADHLWAIQFAEGRGVMNTANLMSGVAAGIRFQVPGLRQQP